MFILRGLSEPEIEASTLRRDPLDIHGIFNPSILKNEVDVGRDMTKVRKIGILVFTDVEVLELCGSLDAFVYADRLPANDG